MKKNPGIQFQEFVAMLERVVSHRPGATIESPKRIRDKDTGALREHDVVITWKNAHHDINTAIECRDKSRPVGVGEVEAFAVKCQKTGIHHGVIVSSNGFCGTAKTKAAALNIAVMTLKEASAFDWMGINFIVEFTAVWGPLRFTPMTKEGPLLGWVTLFDSEGTNVTVDMLRHLVAKLHPKPNLPRDQDTDEVFPVAIVLGTEGWTALVDGTVYEVVTIPLETSFTVERVVMPVALHSYSGETGSYEIASTDLKVGGVPTKLIFVKDAEGLRVEVRADAAPSASARDRAE